ncbi:MAG: hypothetical protein CL610_16560 [Anaerolineaceae bacterium]|nr:hypothetical protein [Anaerolineaceae bacterium]
MPMGTYTDLLKIKPPATKAAQSTVWQRVPEQVNTRSPEHPNTRTGEHVNRRTPERPIGRQSYNVFLDQHEALKRLEAQSFLSGKSLSLSDMVRQALDDYIRKQS